MKHQMKKKSFDSELKAIKVLLNALSNLSDFQKQWVLRAAIDHLNNPIYKLTPIQPKRRK